MTRQEKILKALYILSKSPDLFLKYVDYRLRRLGPKWKKTYQGVHQISIGEIKFNIDFDELGSNLYSKQLYFKCYEFHLIKAMNQFLTKGSKFIDVGANVGYLTAVGASLVGKAGEVVSFEPVPKIYSILKNISTLNPEYNIMAYNNAIGESNALIEMDCTSFSDYGGSTAVSGLLNMNNIEIKNKIKVESIRLDDYLLESNMGEISFIKIDVEGYEFSALKGLERYFTETPYRPAIVCEIAPTAHQLLQITVQDILSYMSSFGYQAFDIYDYRKKLTSKNIKQNTDVVFVHDLRV